MVATPGTIPALPQYQPGALHLAGTEAVEIVNSTVATAAASYFMFLTDICGKVPSVLPGAAPSLSDRFALYQAATGLPISAALSDLAIPQGNVVVGGTAGQVYVKNSATNFDASWTTSINFLQLQTASIGTCFATNGVITNLTVGTETGTGLSVNNATVSSLFAGVATASALTVTGNAVVNGIFDAGAGSANFIAITGQSSGNAPLIIAEGSDTNVGLIFQTQGTGGLLMVSAGGVALFANNQTTSCVNFLQVNGGQTGTGPSITAQGGDTNMHLFVGAKGTGTVNLEGATLLGTAALASGAVNGFLHLATTNGTPTGTPTTFSGRAPLVYDTTNNKLWFYNGAWRAAVFT